MTREGEGEGIRFGAQWTPAGTPAGEHQLGRSRHNLPCGSGACISKQSLKIFLTTSLLKTNEVLTETQRKPLFGISKHFVKGSLDLDGELA